MEALNNVNGVLHHIRCKLYPNYLPKSGGPYIARTDNEASLTVEQVCAALKSRGGFQGNYEDLVKYVKQYHDEAAYQLCDGFAVNSGYYTVYPKIGGTFDSVNEAYNPEKHPVSFHFRINSMLRRLAGRISVEIEGLAEVSGYIDKFIDTDEDSTNGMFTAGNVFKILGHKIKLEGESPDIGVFFVPVDAPSQEVKVQRVADNTPTKIVGVIPKVKPRLYKIEIRTQFNGSGYLLKAPRVISGGFVLEAS